MLARVLQLVRNPQHQPLLLILISTLASLVLYLPYLPHHIDVMFRFWDGPNYLYVARTLYDIPVDHPFTAYKTTPAYFACHLPLYPILIRLLSYVFGYPAAMLAVTLICSGLATWLFYLLLRETGAVQSPFWSALISIFLPMRWLLYHSVGATEPLFLVLVFGSMLCWLRGKYGWACALAGLSSITRIVGVLVGVGYFLTMLHEKRWKSLPWLALIPIPLLVVFAFYAWRFGDFFAYFSWNSKLLHAWPLDVLKAYAGNRESIQYAELYVVLYAVYGAGVAMLWRWPVFFWYSLVFYIFNLFIFHEDLSRYYIPIAHLALIVAYDKIFSQKSFKWAFPLMLVPIYLYLWPQPPHNAMADWIWPELLKALR